MRLIKEDGSFTDSDEEIIDVLARKFQKIYNSDVEINWTVIDELKQKRMYNNMNKPLSLL